MKFQSRLIREARASGLLLPAAVFCGLISGGLIILQSYQLSNIISGVFLEQKTLSQVIPLMSLVLIIVTARAGFTTLNEIIAGRLAVKVKVHLRRLLIQKIDRLGPFYLKGERTGELTTTLLQGVDALDTYFSQYLPQILIAVLLPLCILLVVFPIDLITGIVFLVTAPLIPLFMMLIGWASEVQTRKQWLARTRLGSYLLDTLQGIAELKALGRSRERAEEVREVSDQYRIMTMKVLRITFLSALVLELVATLSTAVVAVEVGLRLLYGGLEFQPAFFILLIAPEFYVPMRNLSARFHAGMAGVTAARRIYEILDTSEPPHRVEVPITEPENQFSFDFVISLRNVNFSYPGQEVDSLHNINLELHRGQHYALVGKSGSGKSTLAQILLRLLDPETGEILLNDLPAAIWTRQAWHRHVCWVPQKPVLFNRSLLENITLGNDKYLESEINKAISCAALDDVVRSLPQGLNTSLLEGGARLSGGEAQRVALARAFLANPNVLIMDEPSAHLDIELEKKIHDSTRRLMSGRTTLTIAHRFSTIQTADKIFVMDNGNLVDSGNHEELLIRCEIYRRLITAGRRKD